jgi:hypothetical protein
MKHLLLTILMLGAAAVLAGCPIYSDKGNYRVCNSDGCFDCPDTTKSGACIPWPCNTSADCSGGSACTEGVCGPITGTPPPSYCCDPTDTFCQVCPPDAGASCARPTDCPSGSVCGHDGTCHSGDCGGSVGCVGALVCKVEDGLALCVSTAGDASVSPDGAGEPDGAHPPLVDGADQSSHDSAVGADAPASPADGSLPDGSLLDVSGPDASVPDGAVLDGSVLAVAPCNADSECSDAGAGAKCIDGECIARGQLCSDGTQCIVAGESCVDGVCTPKCSASAPCPAGFGCDFTRHVCSDNPRSCAANGDCQGGTVCVEGHCAAPCVPPDSGAACPSGQVCVNAGCIPDQRASFACFNDGEQGPLANRCEPADICLHGDCYLACDITSDAGGCASGGACKEVSVAKGTFSVCATATTLGSECDAAAGRTCQSGALCVDGYCL